MAAARRRKTLMISAVALAGLTLVGAGVASLYGSGQIETRLQRMGAAAGLTMTHEGVSVSPMGEASVRGLRFARADGSAVLAVREIHGALSPVDALRGRRRPDAVTVRGLRLDVRVVDGKPVELLRLARAARAALGSGKRTSSPGQKAGVTRGTALALEDGEVSVRLEGRGAAFVPGGLKLSGMRVDIDTAKGRGDVAAQVTGAAQAKLSAKLRPAVGDAPARVEARFAPALRLPLPSSGPLNGLVDAVEVAGLGFDAVDGPRVEGIRLLRDKAPVVTVVRAGLGDAGGSVVAGPVSVDLSHAQLSTLPELRPFRAALSRFGTAVWHLDIAQVELASDQVAAVATQASGGLAVAKAGAAKAGAAKAGAAKAGAAKGPTAPATEGEGQRETPGRAPRAGDAPAPGGGTTRAGEPPPPGGSRVTLADVRLRPPAGPLTVSVGRVAVDVDLDSPDKLRRVALDEPVVRLVWRQSEVKGLPLGARIYGLVERLRGHKAPPTAAPNDADADADADATDDDEAKAADARTRKGKARRGKRKKRTRRRRKRGRRVPATKKAIAPLRALHAQAVRVDDRVSDAVLKLAKLPAALTISRGRVDLVAPAADAAFAGLRAGSLSVGRRTADGSRTVSASVEPFVGEVSGGAVSLSLAAAPGGRLAKLSLKLGGALWAKLLSTLGNAASTRADASLSVDLTLTAGQHNHPTLSGKLQVSHVGVNWWRIAPRPIDDFSFAGTFTLSASPSDHSLRLHIDPLDLGGAKLAFQLEALSLAKRPTVHLRVHGPKQDCGKVAAAIPPSLTPIIGTIEAEGEIGGTFDLTLPLDNPYKGKLKATLDDEGCVVTQFGELDVEGLGKAFKRPVNESGTLLEDQLIGPRSDAWVPLKELPPWVPYAMIATEDAAFYHHRGVRVGLTSRAIKMCLDYGRFVYGGSTITQQLVKNLFLTRDKNLARKFEELLIVWHMERALYSKERLEKAEDDERPIKDRILELYVNGIEFAPHLYGIQRGAKLYFDKDARKLTPLETAFLAANKPCPKCGHKRFETKKWTAWWQERMVNIMNKMRTEGIITEAQFAAEAPYVPRFVGWPQAEQPSAAGGGSVGGEEE